MQHASACRDLRADAIEPRIAYAAAEQEAVVRGTTEVVEHEVYVRDGDVLSHERFDPFFAQRLGRDDVGADRHDARAQTRGEGPDVSVAAQRDELRSDLAVLGHDERRLARPNLYDARVLVDRHAVGARGGGEPQRVVERMQVAAAAIEDAGAVATRREQRFDLCTFQKLNVLVAVHRPNFGDLLEQLGTLAGLDRREQRAPMQIALDRVALDQIFQELERLNRDVPHLARGTDADLLGDFVLTGRESRQRLSAAAPRCAPPDAMPFQERDAITPLRKVQRSRAPGHPAADDADVRVDVSAERRVVRRRIGGRCVVGADVICRHRER